MISEHHTVVIRTVTVRPLNSLSNDITVRTPGNPSVKDKVGLHNLLICDYNILGQGTERKSDFNILRNIVDGKV